MASDLLWFEIHRVGSPEGFGVLGHDMKSGRDVEGFLMLRMEVLMS